MHKDFDKWNIKKKLLHNMNTADFYIQQKDIWYIMMGNNIGYEEDGKNDFRRPVIVLKKVGILYFTVALTTQGKLNSPFYFKLLSQSPKSSFAILSQARVYDKKRFLHKIGTINEKEFSLLTKSLIRTHF